MLDHERFDVYAWSLDLLDHLRLVVIDALPRGHRHLGHRVLRASTSLVVDVAAAVGKPARRDKRGHFRGALAAATKCAAVFDVLRQLDLLGTREYRRAKSLVESIVHGLTDLLATLRGEKAKDTLANRPSTSALPAIPIGEVIAPAPAVEEPQPETGRAVLETTTASTPPAAQSIVAEAGDDANDVSRASLSTSSVNESAVGGGTSRPADAASEQRPIEPSAPRRARRRRASGAVVSAPATQIVA